MADLLAPVSLQSAIDFDRAAELLAVLATSTDGDEIADALEVAASDAELAHALLYRLVCLCRGWEETRSGVELVAGSGVTPELWTP